jgi:hypothetical protein
MLGLSVPACNLSLHSEGAEVKSLKQLRLEVSQKQDGDFSGVARCSFSLRQAIFHHFSSTITILGSRWASLMKSLVLCPAVLISLPPLRVPFFLCFLVSTVPVMIDGWKWSSWDELVIGLVLRLCVCRVSGAASDNEPKEMNGRHRGLDF